MPRTRRKKGLPGSYGDTAYLIDIVVRVFLGAWFALTAISYFRNALVHWQIIDLHQSVFLRITDAVSFLAVGIFSLSIAFFYVIRLQPVSRFAGVLPALTAALGTFLAWSLLLLNMRMDLSAEAKILAALLITAGNIFAFAALRHLGRSFSIFPEGRRLVTSGPYRFVRHPLYIGEGMATIGAMIYFLSPAAAAIVVMQLLLQFARMRYEERVLRETFPEYAAYARRTARLIPGIY